MPETVRFPDVVRRGRTFRTRPPNPADTARAGRAPFARRPARPRRSGMDARLGAGHDEAERTAPWSDEGAGTAASPLLPLREKVDRPEAEPDEGCCEERGVAGKVLTALRFSPSHSVQHPSSGRFAATFPRKGGRTGAARCRDDPTRPTFGRPPSPRGGGKHPRYPPRSNRSRLARIARSLASSQPSSPSMRPTNSRPIGVSE